MAKYTYFTDHKLRTEEEFATFLENSPWLDADALDFRYAASNGKRLPMLCEVVTETPKPDGDYVLSENCLFVQHEPLNLAEGEVWDGTPVYHFETVWVEA
tara:strand:+ start:747 stop:1046 length:300 start_codon:yes stop_codon:yes gene_type:complete